MVDLRLHSLSFDGITAGAMRIRPGAAGDDFSILAGDEEGVEGLGLPQFRTTLTRGQGHGATPGSQWGDPVTIQARLCTRETDQVMRLRQAMKPRPNPLDELPLSFRGLGFPDTHRLWVRPDVMDYRVGRLATQGDLWIVDAAWTSSDGVIYHDEEVTYPFGGGGSPVSEADLEVPNAGLDYSRTGRALQIQITPHGPVVNPVIRIDHPDGSYERIFWLTTLQPGQQLTVDEHRVSRIGGMIAAGFVRSTGPGGVTTNAPRWPILHPGANTVKIRAASGLMSGFVKAPKGVW